MKHFLCQQPLKTAAHGDRLESPALEPGEFLCLIGFFWYRFKSASPQSSSEGSEGSGLGCRERFGWRSPVRLKRGQVLFLHNPFLPKQGGGRLHTHLQPGPRAAAGGPPRSGSGKSGRLSPSGCDGSGGARSPGARGEALGSTR